jgi:carbonic anhydrase
MTQIDDLLRLNARYADGFTKGDLPAPPARRVAVLACMDARLDPARVLGLDEGEAHVIRNAGGVVTDDAIRSLAISQHLLGTEEVMLIHHTRCGMLGLSDEDFAERLEREAGARPPWQALGFSDLERSVRDSIARLERSPFLPRRDRIRGFVYDVETGRLREVSDQGAS